MLIIIATHTNDTIMININKNTNNNEDLLAQELLGVLAVLWKGVLALALALALLEQADAKVVGDDLANNSNMNNNY